MEKTVYYRVRRPFDAFGVQRMPGEILDTGDWQHGRAAQLCSARLLEPVPYEAPAAVACKCKRMWSPDVVKVTTGKCPIPNACVDPKVVSTQITETVEAPMSDAGRQAKQAFDKRREMTAAASSKE